MALIYEVPQNETPEKLQRRIYALEYTLKRDTREKDRKIHKQALKALKSKVKNMREVVINEKY
ncbi:hypothetical protein [Clostridium tyrobutyricum]|uniref:hypothetical protein n=1 Tax=Clostridium tyrobutyricum TaxID=1519 RepID=UPI0030CB56A4